VRPGAIWIYSFSLVTALLVLCLVIYGFDLTTPKGTRKALTKEIKNSGKTNFFYALDEKFAFFAFTDRGPEVGLTTYTRNYVPFCFVCGWNMGDPEDDRGLNPPVYKSGDLLYSERTDYAWEGIPEGVFPTFNMTSKKFGFVKDSLELGPAPFDRHKKLLHSFVAENFDELSYESADDEDCMISFGALFLCYIILGVWWLIQVLVWVIRRKVSR
jgi:hypothetical protein